MLPDVPYFIILPCGSQCMQCQAILLLKAGGVLPTIHGVTECSINCYSMQTDSSDEKEAEQTKPVIEPENEIEVTTEEKPKDTIGETLICGICQVLQQYRSKIIQQFFKELSDYVHDIRGNLSWGVPSIKRQDLAQAR